MQLSKEEFDEKMAFAEEDMCKHLEILLAMQLPAEIITFSVMHAFVKTCIAFGDDQEDFRLRLKLVMKHFESTYEIYQEIKEDLID